MNDRRHNYWTYIMASKSGVLYTGMTNDLERRVAEHKEGLVEGFTSQYKCTRLVWYEEFREVRDAIETEKRIKGWSRVKKVKLIEEKNPRWQDLSDAWSARTAPEDSRDSSSRRSGIRNDNK